MVVVIVLRLFGRGRGRMVVAMLRRSGRRGEQSGGRSGPAEKYAFHCKKSRLKEHAPEGADRSDGKSRRGRRWSVAGCEVQWERVAREWAAAEGFGPRHRRDGERGHTADTAMLCARTGCRFLVVGSLGRVMPVRRHAVRVHAVHRHIVQRRHRRRTRLNRHRRQSETEDQQGEQQAVHLPAL